MVIRFSCIGLVKDVEFEEKYKILGNNQAEFTYDTW